MGQGTATAGRCPRSGRGGKGNLAPVHQERMGALEDPAWSLEADPLQGGGVGQPGVARVLVADLDLAHGAFQEEEADVLLDERVAAPEAVVGVVLEAFEDALLLDGDAGL